MIAKCVSRRGWTAYTVIRPKDEALAVFFAGVFEWLFVFVSAGKADMSGRMKVLNNANDDDSADLVMKENRCLVRNKDFEPTREAMISAKSSCSKVFIRGKMSKPCATAREPPGKKSFCTSTTNSALAIYSAFATSQAPAKRLTP